MTLMRSAIIYASAVLVLAAALLLGLALYFGATITAITLIMVIANGCLQYVMARMTEAS